MTNETSDTELLELVSNGDRDAFGVFLSRHLNTIVRFAYRYLSNKADAEDIAQETFIRVWKKSVSWQPQGHSPLSWVYRIAYNLCIDELRRRPAKPANADEVPVENLSVSMEQDTDIEQLSVALQALPERQRAAISLCALQGLSNKEAASVMQISVDALESLLSRGRRQLRKHLEQDISQQAPLLSNPLLHNKGNPT